MSERIQQEINLLQTMYPDLQFGQDFAWVLLPHYRLPPIYNSDETPMMWRIPPGYPQTGPDDFFVDGKIRLKNGGNPPSFNIGPNSSSGVAPIPGDWGWFSWHPESWHPTAMIDKGDNLLTFLRSVNICLRGENQ